MAFKYANMAKEQASNKPASSATAFNLGGAETGFQGFVAAVATGVKSLFRAYEVDADGNPSGAWQIFYGTVTDATPDTVSQDTLIESSSIGSFIDFSGSTNAPMLEAVASADEYDVNFPLPTGAWIQPSSLGKDNGSFPSGAPSANAIYGLPFVIPKPISLDEVRVNVAGAGSAGDNVRIGIYESGTDGLPGALAKDCGELDISTTGVKAATALATDLMPGVYWWMIHFETNNGTFSGVSGNQMAPYGMGMMTTSDFDRGAKISRGGVSYAGGLPDPYGAGAVSQLNNTVLVELKFAEL